MYCFELIFGYFSVKRWVTNVRQILKYIVKASFVSDAFLCQIVRYIKSLHIFLITFPANMDLCEF